MTTLLVSGVDFLGESLTLEGDSFRHLFRARRLAVGDVLRVVDGAGRARTASVTAVGRRQAELELGKAAPSREPSRRLEVWVAPPKIGRASWMVEKLTELGVGAIHFWNTDRGTRQYGEANLARLGRLAVSAVEQCGRSRVPVIDGVHSWTAGLERLRGLDRIWLLAPDGEPVPRLERDDTAPIALLVGPEGGWTDAEMGVLGEAGGRRLGLGRSILRTETAAVAGASLALFA